jgi:predicted chitinase
MKNELASYFGKNYQTDPSELKGLNAVQKSNFSIIIQKAKSLGITSNYAIAGLLGIVSKESAFKATTEGSYKGTSPGRVRQVFGSQRTSKYNDGEIKNYTQSDIDFFDLVYGYIAKGNGFSTYGNDSKGDGFRYRGRGFNQLTFKNIYKDRGQSVGLDLVNKPELLDNPDSAASVLISYYLNAFKGLSNDVAKSVGITKQSNPLATINSITSFESAVDLFYLATSGSMVYSNYKKILNYKSGSYRDSSGVFVFPNDSLGGYTKARNRAPYFYQILTGNKLPDTPPVNNEPKPNQNFGATQSGVNDTIIQQDAGDDQDGNNPTSKNQDFNPTQLTQIFKPTIKPIDIKLEAEFTNKRQRKDFLVGMGTAPVIYYNGIHIEYRDVSNFELYHESILPAIKMTFSDRNGIFRDKGFPLDDTIISIFIYSRSKRLRSIRMDFKVTQFRDFGGNQFSLNGVCNIPKIYLRKFQSFSKKTSFEALQDLAKQCELGFCSNISNTNDKMTWINTGFPNYQFVDSIVKNSYLSDEAFLNCYIDFYYNICYVDLEKELNRENSNDKMIVSNGYNEFSSNREQDEDISNLFLTTDHSAKGTNAFISEFIVNNNSTRVSLNRSYLTKTKFYDSRSKELLIFDVDSITSEGDKTIILKGKPGEEEFFKDNVTNIWIGKLDKFEDDGSGNAHSNFNYSIIQNEINIDELMKISIEITLPSPNYNLYIFQKVYLALLKEKPGVNHNSLRIKRLMGNWLITSINYNFDGKFQQKITLIKRELELDLDEQQSSKPSQTNSENSGEDNQQPNELSPNDQPANNPTPDTQPPQGGTQSQVT